MNKQEAIEKVLLLVTVNVKNELSPDGVSEYVSRKRVIDFINQIDDRPKVKLTKAQADYLESFGNILDKCSKDFRKALYFISSVGFGCCFRYSDEVYIDWLSSDYTELSSGLKQEELKVLLIEALVNGYEVEREKLYTVEIPNPNETDCVILLAREDDGKIVIGGDFYFDEVPNDKWKEDECARLTESEIRKDFEWAWQFAEEVED